LRLGAVPHITNLIINHCIFSGLAQCRCWAQLNLRRMLNLFQQKTATLFNGKKVKEGDKVYFINSDGVRCEGLIQRRKFDVKLASPHYGTPRSKEPHKETMLKKGTLFFWNYGFLIEDYVNLDVVA
jgi:hypothetical protein